MATNDTYLAVLLGSKTSARMEVWMALPEAERRAKEQEGVAAVEIMPVLPIPGA